MTTCLVCGSRNKNSSYKYCSNVCQATFQYKAYIQRWKSGQVTGSRGIFTKNISAHIKRYLFETYGEKCVMCGWSKRHAITHHVPLEIDHIDGNADNNAEKNLRLLCPNCHSLSINFKNLNKGHGRSWRKNKYIKN